MPKVRTSRSTPPPLGFEDIEPVLNALNNEMVSAQRDSQAGKRKDEALWPIFRLHHQRSRFVYQMFVSGRISKQVLDYCIEQQYADGALISKWKKPGYESLCCLRCLDTRSTTYSTTCICRVPRKDLEKGRLIECVQCGCRGCSSNDVSGADISLKRNRSSSDKETDRGTDNVEGIQYGHGNDDYYENDGENRYENEAENDYEDEQTEDQILNESHAKRRKTRDYDEDEQEFDDDHHHSNSSRTTPSSSSSSHSAHSSSSSSSSHSEPPRSSAEDVD
jgi:bud site selection protein 31